MAKDGQTPPHTRRRRQALKTPPRRSLPAIKSVTGTELTERHIEDNRTKEVRDSHSTESSPRESESLVNPAHVSVSGGVTKKLEDYESAKVSVMISRPCRDTEEDIDRVYGECSEWVEAKILREIDQI